MPILPGVPTPKPKPKPKHIHVNIPSIMQNYHGKKLSEYDPSSEMLYSDCSLNSYTPIAHLSATPSTPSINKILLIHLLYNLLNEVQSNYAATTIINSVNDIIYSVNNMNI
jgi:hypothetical protein